MGACQVSAGFDVARDTCYCAGVLGRTLSGVATRADGETVAPAGSALVYVWEGGFFGFYAITPTLDMVAISDVAPADLEREIAHLTAVAE